MKAVHFALDAEIDAALSDIATLALAWGEIGVEQFKRARIVRFAILRTANELREREKVAQSRLRQGGAPLALSK